jgi:general secretion pathway protein D
MKINIVIVHLLLLFLSAVSFAQSSNDFSQMRSVQIDEIEFRNQRVQDVLLSLARLGNISIIFDETVTGNTSHYFSDVSLAEAFAIVSNATGVHLRNEDGIWYASKFLIEGSDDASRISLRAEDLTLEIIVKKLSQFSGLTILFDPLPSEPISLNIDGLPLERILLIALSKFPEYELTTNSDYYYIRYTPPAQSAAATPSVRRDRPSDFTRDAGGNYSVNIEGIRFRDAVSDLFDLAGLEFVFLKQSDSIIDRLAFENKSFDEMLNLVLELGEADYAIRDGIYYIIEISRNDILRRFDTTIQIPLENISAETIPSLFPTGLLASSAYKIDAETNSLIITGSLSEIEAATEFISIIDRPQENSRFHRFDLLNSAVEDIVALLPERLTPSRPIIVPNQNAFLIPVNPDKAREIAEFIAILDQDGTSIPVRLQYIQSEDLLENLPPSVTEDNLYPTSDPTLVFFRGGAAVYRQFMVELEQIDKPIPQIRYQLLVIQFQEGARNRFDFTLSNKQSSGSPSDSSFIGFIGNLLQLDFDIISNFGYSFAVELNWSISESEARILADTTLTGLSGEEVDFQNTNTYRYRDTEIDPDTGEAKATGVTREIVSGLFLQVNGWASGDGMITMEIETTVSKQGTDNSDSGNPPPTSERVINSNIRTPSGQPVIIGGLVNQESDSSTTSTPLLGRIPLLGNLFNKQQESLDNTELMIYIIPYIEYPFSHDTPTSELLDQLYVIHMEE